MGKKKIITCSVNWEWIVVDINRDAKWRGNNRSDEGLTLETSAFLLFTVANLRQLFYSLRWLIYAAPQFL